MKENNLSIVLASASPRRLHLLQKQGFTVEVIPPDINENKRPGEGAKSYVTRLATEKAQTILEQLTPGCANLLLAADTTVAFQNHILEKPMDYAEAYRMLHMLSGNSHTVYTGYALVSLPKKHWHIACIGTDITFHTLSEQQIHEYVATGDPFDKAGGYGIQNVYDTFVKTINGSYYNVMGLPIEDILKTLASRN